MVSDRETMTERYRLGKYDSIDSRSGIYDNLQVFGKLVQGWKCYKTALGLFQCFFECLCNFRLKQKCLHFRTASA
jgi:hypothetical protein